MKIAIAGFGAEGRSNYRYFARQDHEVVIVDEHEISDAPVDASIITGKDAFSRLKGFDMVVRTAGLAPRKITTDGVIWSATNEFFDKCPASIIGVTGSKGKGTTASLTASILREAGQTVHLLGNIGVPALDVLEKIAPDDIVVYEMSSFQLWDLKKSPNVAVVLMIEPDHLDVHADFDEYIAAKANIRKYQTQEDICFYHPTNIFSKQIATIAGDQNACAYNDSSDSRSVYVSDGNFITDDCIICPTSALQLPGIHNLDNACAAICAALEYTSDWGAVDRGLRAFHGLNHRLKFVREVSGVKYYDDSIATTPGSAIAAMKAFDQTKVLILGGSSKGADFTELARTAAAQSVSHVILIGSEADSIERAFTQYAANVSVSNLGVATNMKVVVTEAAKQARPNDVIVLSPACASFGMFKNYSDRGDQFIAAVEAL